MINRKAKAIAMNINQPPTSCTHPMDTQVPGGVYLCQINDTVSCGACCGLYNVADPSREHLTRMLRDRTRRFARVPRTAEGIDAFALENQTRESQTRPFPQFHHCPFTGLIGPALSRVGCLLHPLGEGNNGVDFRGLSYYGGLACHSYFCPATHQLKPRHKKVLRAVIDDWHLYGLVVTEGDLVGALFHEIETRTGRPVAMEQFIDTADARRRLIELLRLKIDWPFRPSQTDTPCHYFFFDVSYDKPAIAYERLGLPPSRHDTILRELVSEFHCAEDLRQAEQCVGNAIAAVVRALGAIEPT